MDGLTISISIIALLVSVSSFQWNKAKHNLNQLQDNAKKFCDSLHEFISLGSEHHLIFHKYEIENIYYLSEKKDQHVAFNNLQMIFSKRRDDCKKKYKELMECLDFFEISGANEENQLLKWLNERLNAYYLKLHNFYGNLFDINSIVKRAENRVLNKEEKEFIDSFFSEVRDLLDYHVAFSILKRYISGYFAKLSLKEVGFFGRTKLSLIQIEREIMRFVIHFGFDDALNNKDYTKIKKNCLDFGEKYDEFVLEERNDFLSFLNSIKIVKK